MANAGDSRAILIKARMRRAGSVRGEGNVGGGMEVSDVKAMSTDHTADDPQERERITAAGGTAFEVCHTRADGTTLTVRN